ncbi:acyl-CoA dehydrogenase [Candidatus Woesearchaeota archaeon]|nr:acyl-CoA dehydrogenase [Candidatus Woesearchaeota archaeon]
MIALTEEQKIIQQTVREFAREVVAPKAREIDKSKEFPVDTIRQMAKLSLMGIPFPDKYGGAGADKLSYIIAVEELARACGSTSITLAAHTSLGCNPIYMFGTDDQKKKFLTPLAQGDKVGGLGITEPEAGSDVHGIKTAAQPSKNGYVLNGAKMFITNANVGDTFVVAAKDPSFVPTRSVGTTEGKPSSNKYTPISLFIVERGYKGFSNGKSEDKMGLRASDTGELVFQDCFVPGENLLGKRGDGFKYLMQTLDGGRISIGALALGLAQGAMDKSVAYSKERKQFGKPICDFQAVQNMIADMAVETEAARHLVYDAARLYEAGLPFAKESAMAKLFASETAMRVTRNAIQILGGYGYMNEYEVERYYRDAKLCEIGEGTSEIQRIVIARQVIGTTDTHR